MVDTSGEYEFEDDNSKSIAEYKALIKRRKRPIFITSAIVVCLSVLLAFLWPPTYQSAAVVLIEEQDIPQDLVRTTVTSYAVQRIEEIKQRIMTVGNIMSIVEKFELYSEKELNRLTRTAIAQEFRRSVSISPISAEVIDPRSGRPSEAVIAFSMSYKGNNLKTVHKVTNELVTLFLNENLRDRTEQSASTSQFLSSEVNSLNENLIHLEKDIAHFKEIHKSALPELQAFNMGALERVQTEISQIQTKIQDLNQQKIILTARLGQIDPSGVAITAAGDTILSPSERLRVSKAEYLRLKSIYKEDHPTLRRLSREISGLESESSNLGKEPNYDIALRKISSKLEEARTRYKDDHPVISGLLNQQEELLNKIDTQSLNKVWDSNNPAYIALSTQVATIDSEVSALKNREKELQVRRDEYENSLELTPSVEKEYHALQRDYENAKLKYREIKAKQMTAELAQNLEQERKGERFTLIQPPEIPEEPISPNRSALFFVGFVLAFLLGGSNALLLEKLDPRVYGVRGISKAMNLEPLIAIPIIDQEQPPRHKWRLTLIWGGLFLLLCCIALLIFHLAIKPLDVTWYILMRKLGWM